MAMKKVIMEMIEKIPGGKSAVAGFLGFSEAELKIVFIKQRDSDSKMKN